MALLDFFAKAQEARELIKNCELNLYVSRDGLSHCTNYNHISVAFRYDSVDWFEASLKLDV